MHLRMMASSTPDALKTDTPVTGGTYPTQMRHTILGFLNILASFPLQYLVMSAAWGQIDFLDNNDNFFGKITVLPTGIRKSRPCRSIKDDDTLDSQTALSSFKTCVKYIGGLGRSFNEAYRNHKCSDSPTITKCISLKTLAWASTLSILFTILGVLFLLTSAVLLMSHMTTTVEALKKIRQYRRWGSFLGLMGGCCGLAVFLIQWFLGVRNLSTTVLDAYGFNEDPFPVTFMKMDAAYLFNTHWILLGISLFIILANLFLFVIPPLNKLPEGPEEETSGLLVVSSPPVQITASP
eukprot:Blabericola_migrator_1__243@NODE_1064_length_5554_cov_25_974121_g731_i0_p3_GENE_NODE_1064_length_5554_cov_25_974121_g731_i0NODE_1064_length_5554_cov_25_974121_g731_i0_p3_ORF_typecomplete_len294_score62_98DUF2269/PF10027_9/2_4e02DUF2269/PF10027_9/0_069Virul_fac_BrkB/PF03631_15/0_17SNF/PF00209_18/2_5e02SNF/PF00209_18/0_078DUF3784/PF12650_7/0_11DUF1418/PF07214_12/0_14DUF1418/PF07214_12/1_4e03DUF872/PF05915_12/0_33DUF872/PF05915_12/3_3e03L_HMGIC_fpl/PF10242_9/0_07L_HMGIC_fpl/PF10242_9/1_9e03DUF2207/